MRKLIILILVLISMLNNVSAKENYLCSTIGVEGLCFDVEFVVTTDTELNIPAKYNFPYFIRAGDYLYIKKIKVSNINNSTKTQAGIYTLDIRTIDYSDLPYTDLKKVYPIDL